MDLRGTFRQAEQQVARSARRGAQRAKAGVEAMEASILRTLKSHSNSANSMLPMSAHPEQEPEPAAKVRTGIVSVNGQDVGKMRCTGGR
jgi:hypothetical protein